MAAQTFAEMPHLAGSTKFSSKMRLPDENVDLSNVPGVHVLREQARPKTAVSLQDLTLKNSADFERELSRADPADVLREWYKYVGWTKKHKPNDLQRIIAQACRSLTTHTQHHADVHYLRLLVMHAGSKSEPHKFFQAMEARGVGTHHALLYEAWASALERCRCFPEAGAVFKRGLAKRAQPLDRLRDNCKKFCKRMHHRHARSAGSPQLGHAAQAKRRDALAATNETPRRVTKSHLKFARQSLGGSGLHSSARVRSAASSQNLVPERGIPIVAAREVATHDTDAGAQKTVASCVRSDQPSRQAASLLSQPGVPADNNTVEEVVAPPAKRQRTGGLGAWLPFRGLTAAFQNPVEETDGPCQATPVYPCATATAESLLPGVAAAAGGTASTEPPAPISVTPGFFMPDAASRRAAWGVGIEAIEQEADVGVASASRFARWFPFAR